MQLVLSSTRYKDSFLAAIEEYRAEDNLRARDYQGLGVDELRKNFGAALHKAKTLGIEKVLVTCDATNLASKKVIEANGVCWKMR